MNLINTQNIHKWKTMKLSKRKIMNGNVIFMINIIYLIN